MHARRMEKDSAERSTSTMAVNDTTQAVIEETKQAPIKSSAVPTPKEFYRKLTQREDIRTILKRLAKN